MAQPTAPQPNSQPTPAPADLKGKGPELPPPPAAPAAAEGKTEPAKPANPLEAELAEKFGDEWAALSPKVREHAIAAEMKSREADKRMQLSAKLKKDLDMTNAQVGQLFDMLRKDPWKVLQNPALGHDVRKLAEEYVWSMIQEQRLSPEQREAREAKNKLAEYEQREKQRQESDEQSKLDALTAQRRAYWEKTIPEAIDAAGLPKTSYVVRRFVDYIRSAAKSRTPADMPTIAQHVKQELVDLQSKFLLPPKRDGESDDQYEERVLNSAPNDYVKLLRKADLKRLRAKGLAPKPGPKPTSQPTQKGNGKTSMEEWLNARDQRMGRR